MDWSVMKNMPKRQTLSMTSNLSLSREKTRIEEEANVNRGREWQMGEIGNGYRKTGQRNERDKMAFGQENELTDTDEKQEHGQYQTPGPDRGGDGAIVIQHSRLARPGPVFLSSTFHNPAHSFEACEFSCVGGRITWITHESQ